MDCAIINVKSCHIALGLSCVIDFRCLSILRVTNVITVEVKYYTKTACFFRKVFKQVMDKAVPHNFIPRAKKKDML